MDSQARDIIAQAQRYTATRWGHSRYSEWHRCEYAHWLRYHKKLRPAVNDISLDIGSAVHIGLAAGMLGYKLGRTDLSALALFAVETEPRIQEEAKVEGRRLLEVYEAHWGELAWNFGGDVIAVEEYLEANVTQEPLPKGETSTFPPTSTRVDAIVRIPWGRGGHPHMTWAWVDHKTRKNSVPGKTDPEKRAEFVRGLYTDDQFLRHSYCFWRRTGRVRPGILNFLIKTKTPQYERISICHTEEQIKRWAKNEDLRVRAYSFELEHQQEPIMQYGECDPAIGQRCWAFNWCHGLPEAKAEKFYVAGSGKEEKSDEQTE